MTFRRRAGQYLLWAVLRSFLIALCRTTLLARRRRIFGSGPASKAQVRRIWKECKRYRSSGGRRPTATEGLSFPSANKGKPTSVSDDLKLQLATRGVPLAPPRSLFYTPRRAPEQPPIHTHTV